MMKIVILCSLILIYITSFGYSQEHEPAALAPMGIIGKFSELEQYVIFSSLHGFHFFQQYPPNNFKIQKDANVDCVDYWQERHPELKKFSQSNNSLLRNSIAKGGDDILFSMLILRGCPVETQFRIGRKLKSQYNQIYKPQSTNPLVKSHMVLVNINDVISADPWLFGLCNSFTPACAIAFNK